MVQSSDFFYLYCDELDTHCPRGSVDPWSLPRTFFFSYLIRSGLHALVLVSAGYWLEGVTYYMYLWPGTKILCIKWNLDRPCHDRTKVNVFWVSAIKFKSSINSNWLRSTVCNFFPAQYKNNRNHEEIIETSPMLTMTMLVLKNWLRYVLRYVGLKPPANLSFIEVTKKSFWAGFFWAGLAELLWCLSVWRCRRKLSGTSFWKKREIKN